MLDVGHEVGRAVVEGLLPAGGLAPEPLGLFLGRLELAHEAGGLLGVVEHRELGPQLGLEVVRHLPQVAVEAGERARWTRATSSSRRNVTKSP